MHLADLLRQVSILLSLPAVLLLGMAAALIVLVRDWRLALFAYAFQSVLLSTLLAQVIPVEWALLHAIVGGLISVMLFLSARQMRGGHLAGIGREVRWPQLPSLPPFRLLALVLAAVAFPALRDLVDLPLVSSLFRDAIVWLALVGILGLAVQEEPLHAGLSLLTILGGLLLLLYQLWQSRMVVGLVEGWQLLLGLAVSYLVVARGLAVPTPESGATGPWWRT